MKACAVFCIVAVCALSATAVQLQEKYTIKIKEQAKGESWRVEYKLSHSDGKDKKPMDLLHQIYTDTVLEGDPGVGAGKPGAVKRLYEKDVTGRELKSDLHGKTVMIKKTPANIYEFRLPDGTQVEDDFLLGYARLNAEFNGRQPDNQKNAFVPPVALAASEACKLDLSDKVRDLNKKGETVVESAGTIKLVKIFKKGNHLYGVVESQVEIRTTKVYLPRKEKAPRFSGPGSTEETTTIEKTSFEGCIDGTFAEGRLHITTTIATTTTLDSGNISSSFQSITTNESWEEIPNK